MYIYTENYYKEDDNIARKIIDLDLNFRSHPVTKDLQKKYNIEALKQSLKTLILLNHYEKPFHPDIGCDIYKSLFEPFEEEFTQTLLKKYIKDVIDNYEPRVELTDINIEVISEEHSLKIDIYFIPIGEITPINVTLFLRNIR